MAAFINQFFEPVWQSLRPVPIVTLDFGNGNVITRTLHGNIATYICRPSGQILDILPGIYEPGKFIARINEIKLLQQSTFSKMNPDETILHYHKTSLRASREGRKLPRIGSQVSARSFHNYSKKAIELSVIRDGAITMIEESWLDSIKRRWKEGRIKSISAAGDGSRIALKTPAELREWDLLLQDTRLNESVRRRQIHEALAHKLKTPAEVTKWLYKEVLHSDLDDPYLGLGEALFSNYPFAGEDARAH